MPVCYHAQFLANAHPRVEQGGGLKDESDLHVVALERGGNLLEKQI